MRNFVTGTTVVSLRYRDGVIMGADTKGSYGRLAKYTGLQRIFKMGDQTLIGVSGEISDMQYLKKALETLTEEDPRRIDAYGYYKMTQRIMYSARSRMSPLNLSVCVGGVDSVCTAEGLNNQKTLGCVDHLGNFYFSNVVCTGIGAHLVLPLLRSKVDGREDEITREEGISLVEEAMRILFYRDCGASNEIQVGYADAQDAHISDAYRIQTNWDIALREDEIVIE
ncbi:beta type-4 subunit of proteasome [Ordospora colligata]|uniref:Proteasome subunit beta n=1 Tax=Ordospora colligata OC4 TaxID=1354746 RepID=A0A0B2UMH0_9MICR|nr:beta type-4 subunit of proteasome [Ordospora colligata OC4]KHN70573.1 beta type-4 subunit of proteasome [Ordospora colligata OC4]TBU17323.1 beta type-4 subunit of proteasome [Ordospora colligata]TBU17573.1 beta type-4 subunit of proteasome [Ordospora colligata]TBU19753.1 beta type-4 subunit of proteasome [Ordospora colligata]